LKNCFGLFQAAQCKIKLSTLSQATITRLVNEWLRQHPELLLEAAASPIVQRTSSGHSGEPILSTLSAGCACAGRSEVEKIIQFRRRTPSACII
jgi:hypothetical protein